MTLNENSPWMTFFACVLAVLFTLVGGIVALVHTQSLPFKDYLDSTGKAAVAVAALGVGRSLKKGLTRGAGEEVGGSALNRWPVTTFTVGAMVLIAGLTGGVLTIVNPDLLTFQQYLDQMTTFAFAVGIQGAGRAVRKGIEAKGTAETAAAAPTPALQDHPDFAGAAGTGPVFVSTGPEPDFVDPEDRESEDDDLGADEEPGPAAHADDLEDAGADEDEAGLPTDEEEMAHPPPDDADLLPADVYALDSPETSSGPSAYMPSQDEGRP
jgi:hypothetical protein